MYDYIIQDKNRNMRTHVSDTLHLIGDIIVIRNKEYIVLTRELK